MPGDPKIPGIFCSITPTDSRALKPSSVGVVLVFRHLLNGNLFNPNLRDSRYAGDSRLRSSRAANANRRVHRKKCCGNYQKALDVSLFHYFLLQLRASVCSTIVLVLPIKPKRMCIDRQFECPRRERFPDDIE
jgi:hypothetical protein